MRYLFCLIVSGSFLLGAGAAQENDSAKKDLDRLQGVWQMVSMEIVGKSLPEEKIKALKLTFKGNKATHPGADGKTEEATVKLDPSKNPKALDMSPLTGPGKGQTLLAIYAIEGDTLKICGARAGRDRPTEFKGGKDVILMVLTRAKR
jgi:uncharacterized protein (TIGR03067 family)